jgi:hypothetical protein
MWEYQHVTVRKMAIAYSLLVSCMALASSLAPGEASDKKHGSPPVSLRDLAFGGEVMIELTMAKQSTVREFTRAGQRVFFLDGMPMQV